jgi:hypothetical protein
MNHPAKDIKSTKNHPITLYALLQEGAREDPGRTLVFDGIAASSLGAAPSDLGIAAANQWEPNTWMIAVEPNQMKRWPALGQATEETWMAISFTLVTDGDESDGGAYLYTPANQNGQRDTLQLLSVQPLLDSPALRKLNGFARLKGIPAANKQTISQIVGEALANASEKAVVVYDVGQANWNAVVEVGNCRGRPPMPVLFFDCGMPLGRNYSTLPSPIIAPFANASPHAPVILSHWDMDHWSGAASGQPLYGTRGIAINWSPTALDRNWIVPNQGRHATGQKIRPTAWRLALALHRRGKLIIWPTLLNRVNLPKGDSIVKCVPALNVSGKNNNSGLAMIVKTASKRRPDALTILPSDADYASLAINYPELYKPDMCFTGLVASHHGADLVGAPPTALADWSKLAVSHGSRYGHPTSASLAAHSMAGWSYQYETHVRLHRTLPGGASQNSGSVVLGTSWLASDVHVRCQSCTLMTDACPIQ